MEVLKYTNFEYDLNEYNELISLLSIMVLMFATLMFGYIS